METNQIVRAFPLKDQSGRELKHFAELLRTQMVPEAKEFFDTYGVARETWSIQETEHGRWAIVVTELDGREVRDVAEKYQGADAPFHSWFKKKVVELTGIDPNEDPLGPKTTVVFDSSEL